MVKKASTPQHDILIEKDIEIPVRDGARLKADIFRPKSGGRFPAIMTEENPSRPARAMNSGSDSDAWPQRPA